MPWEHVFVGYNSYSLFVHAVYRVAPESDETLVVVFASLLPDLIDKPLAWGLGTFSSGYAVAHSIFFALTLAITVGALASSRDRPRIGWAFGVAYLLHLKTDVLSKFLFDGELRLDVILWPIHSGGDGYERGFTEEFAVNISEYFGWISREVTSNDPDPYLFFVLGIGIVGMMLWVYDGMPVGREAFRTVRRVVRAFGP
jgi:hypothetical protein